MKSVSYKNLKPGEKIASKALGYRSWLISPISKSPRLYSMTSDFYWKPGINNASCFRSRCSPPDKKCDCGFNAWNGYLNVLDYSFGVSTIQGSVSGWGNMQIHKSGWRSEKSEILALYVPLWFSLETKDLSRKDLINCLGECYNVPIFSNSLKLVAYTNKVARREKLIRL